MKTLHTEVVGELRLVLRSDGGVYLGRPDSHGFIARDMMRLGSSAAICGALAEALTTMAVVVRGRALGLSSAAARVDPLPTTRADPTATLAGNGTRYEPEPVESEE